MAHMTTPTIKNRTEDRPAQMGQFATEGAERVKEAAAALGDKAKEAACRLGDAAKETATNLGDKARDAASTVAHRAEDAAAYVGQKVEGATGAMGSGLQSLGQNLREKAPQTGVMGDASSAVARTLENTGRYLQAEGLHGMCEDVTNVIRRNPIPAVLAGIGAGFLIARALNSRS